MNHTIRRACAKDIPQINQLLYQVNNVHADGRPDLFVHGVKKYTDEQLLELLSDEKRPVFVSVNEQNLAKGYAFCIFEEHEENHSLSHIRTLYIDDICVDEQCRNQHIGTSLYEYVIQFARERHCHNVTLNVWECNPDAKKFYEAMGMKPQKIGMETLL